ncbi:MAG: MFS transporter, partial [Alphaproteobacteria bacterium]|nr:MFS transporter [Alphaproteobacteria bacterium]
MTKLKGFFSRQMLIVTAFGFSSGLPLALVFGTLSLWLQDYHIAYRTIGAFSLLRLPYSFKWLWAPLVETVKVPWLYKLGRRRSWALLAQGGLLLSIAGISLLTPEGHILYMAAAAFAISFFSATQDIVLDAFRVELFSQDTEKEVDGATVYVLGYRLGNIMSSAGAIGLAAAVSWNTVYFINALFILIGMAAVLMAKEPKERAAEKKAAKRSVLDYALKEPFLRFMERPYWLAALALVFFYRLSDAYFAPMAYPFYSVIGFSKGEIAYIS